MALVAGGIFPPDLSLNSILPENVSAEAFLAEIERILAEKTASVPSSNHPVLINLSGLPASGKTYRSEKLRAKRPDLLYIGFDEIMESLSEYKKDFAVSPQKAFERWELPARWAGYRLLEKAVENRLPVLFEHSNANPKHLELYKNIIKEGYSVEIRFINAPPETVIPRLQKRARFFPEEQVVERWKTLQKLLPEYKTAVSKFTLLGAWKHEKTYHRPSRKHFFGGRNAHPRRRQNRPAAG